MASQSLAHASDASQGFGLAFIKRMSESLGGTVTFESQEGKGINIYDTFAKSQKLILFVTYLL